MTTAGERLRLLDERVCRELEPFVEDLDVGRNVSIGKDVRIEGGKIIIGDGAVIHEGCEIRVLDRLTIGKRSVMKRATIQGRDITLGREFYCLPGFEIGGGSCFENLSRLKIGYWFHGGRGTFINTARPVEIGDEVGIGGNSNLYTHGAYLNVLDGFPEQWGEISIGNNVWMPNVSVHPKVRIGSNVVIAAGSVVTRDIPSNCFAAGSPCRVVREDCYPKPLDKAGARIKLREILSLNHEDYAQTEVSEEAKIIMGSTLFDPIGRTVSGNSTKETELLRDRLRRHGIRFKVDIRAGIYEPW